MMLVVELLGKMIYLYTWKIIVLNFGKTFIFVNFERFYLFWHVVGFRMITLYEGIFNIVKFIVYKFWCAYPKNSE